MGDDSKCCRKCHQLLPRGSFYPRAASKDGLGSYCRECAKKTRVEYRAANIEKEVAYAKQYYARNVEAICAKAREDYHADRDRRMALHRVWCESNPDAVRRYCREYQKRHPKESSKRVADWCKAHPEFKAFHTRKRRAVERKALPPWITGYQMRQIAEFYKKSAKMTRETGVPHHVDHIIPLQGDTVCGLHVPWNLQVITATENVRKNNRLLAA